MRLTNFATLQDALDYKTVNTKMVSASQMKVFVVKYGLYLFFKNSTDELNIATYDEITSNGEFNFIEGHPSNVIQLLDIMISRASGSNTVTTIDGTVITEKTALGLLKQECIAYCNRENYPFLGTEQDFFDLQGSANSIVEYSEGLDYVVKTTRPIAIVAEIPAPLNYPVTIEVLAHPHIPDTEPAQYVAQGTRAASITIRPGNTSAYISVNTSTSRKVKFSGVSNLNTETKLVIRNT